ncbi:MAG TPA: DUF4863 family protein [Gammaproteobacteria bacterium]|nr:DUF4863 family protein [Gammaproteobacteria bacterium]
MNHTEFRDLLKPATELIARRTINAVLADELNQVFPPRGEFFKSIEQACHDAIAAGWMCTQGSAGRRFGRVIEPCEQTGGLSIDVVELDNIAGPHHRHPNGEICMVMPLTPAAVFDKQPRGWCTYAPDSAHYPTVSNGSALILYLLPEGKIEFTHP